MRGFEIMQSIDEEALTACPECGNAVERVLSGATSIRSERIDAEKLARNGMTTYKRVGKGAYEKVAGDDAAPEKI